MSTPIGATHLACEGGIERACACARTFTDMIPKTFAKTPACGLRAVTSIVSPAEYVAGKLMSAAVTPPPFRFPKSRAVAEALPVPSASLAAPARAAASAVACIWRCVRYQAPTSTASAAKPSRTTMKTTVTTIDCPRSEFILIPLAPFLG